MELDRLCAVPVVGHAFHHELCGSDGVSTRGADLSRRRAPRHFRGALIRYSATLEHLADEEADSFLVHVESFWRPDAIFHPVHKTSNGPSGIGGQKETPGGALALWYLVISVRGQS